MNRMLLLTSALLCIAASPSHAQIRFGPEEALPPLPPNQAGVVRVGDLNGDGRPDFFIGHMGKGLTNDLVWIQNADGSYRSVKSAGLAKRVSQGTYSRTDLASLGDLDGDGDLDIVRESTSTSPYARHVKELLWNRGDGTFPTWTQLPYSNSSMASIDLQLIDIDSDGDLDLFYGQSYHYYAKSWSFGKAHLFLNNGKGKFTELALPSVTGAVVHSRIDAVDIDGNGRLDLFFRVTRVAYGNPPYIQYSRDRPVLFLQSKAGKWSDASTSLGLPAGVEGYNSVLQDLDADGDLDLAQASSDRKSIRLFENVGNGRFKAVAGGLLPGLKMAYLRLAPLDVTGDQRPELLLIYSDTSYKRHYRVYHAASKFALREEPVQNWIPGGRGSFSPDIFDTCDIDGDGDSDFVYMNSRMSQLYFRRGQERELMASALRIGKPFTLIAASNPTGLVRSRVAIVAASGTPLSKGFVVPSVGSWFLAPSRMIWLGSIFLPSPAGLGSWQIPAPPQKALLGKPLSLQGLIFDSKTGARSTRAVLRLFQL